MENTITISTADDLKKELATNYLKQINNYLGDESKALKFLSSVMSSVQRTPGLLKCDSGTVITSFLTMAELNLMPSAVSGEAYVLPYKGKAQFQLGYQGLVTLFYRAGVRNIISEIVRKNDSFKFVNGEVYHEIDFFGGDRGEAIGAYVMIENQSGGKGYKVMTKDEILAIGKTFSQSFNTPYSPWNGKNDPELWMWKKTVLKQAAKLAPKNETINRAIAIDNEESNIAKRQKLDTKAMAFDKEKKRIENHIENAKSLDELRQVQQFIGEYELEELYLKKEGEYAED